LVCGLATRSWRPRFQTFAHAGGFYGYHLPDMDAVADVAAPYYNNDLRGGEGHMEVGKLILNVVKSKATMTLSVKPFGCYAELRVSDGVQSLITEKFPGTIFCAVETSGDGAVNSRAACRCTCSRPSRPRKPSSRRRSLTPGSRSSRSTAFLKEHPRLRGGAATCRAPAAAHTGADLIHEIAKGVRQVEAAAGHDSSARHAHGRARSRAEDW